MGRKLDITDKASVASEKERVRQLMRPFDECVGRVRDQRIRLQGALATRVKADEANQKKASQAQAAADATASAQTRVEAAAEARAAGKGSNAAAVKRPYKCFDLAEDVTSEFPVLCPRDVWEIADEGGPKLDMSKPFVVKSCQEKIGNEVAKLDGFAESLDKFKKLLG